VAQFAKQLSAPSVLKHLVDCSQARRSTSACGPRTVVRLRPRVVPTSLLTNQSLNQVCGLSRSNLTRARKQIAFLLLEFQWSHGSRAAKRHQSGTDRFVFGLSTRAGCHTLMMVHEQMLLCVRVHALVCTRRNGRVGYAFVGCRLHAAVGRRVIGRVEAR
jgi:hypothetical protein